MPKKNRSRKVNFEGKQIPESKLPKGSLFIVDTWYSAARKLPAHLKKTCGHLFRILKGHNYGVCKIEADGTLIPINVPAVDTRSIGDLLSELKRIEKEERQMRGFSKYFWDHMEEQNIGNDKEKMQLYFQECAKLFWLSYATYPEFCEAMQSLEKEKASLGAALMKKTYYVEEKGSGDDHCIILHMHPKPMQLPNDKIDGRWCSQEEYIKLCVSKKEAESDTKMYEKLRRAREESRGNFDWAEDLTPDDYRWGKDIDGRVLKKVSNNLPPFYFAYFKDFPMLTTTTDEDVDALNNENEPSHELYGDSRNRYEEFKKQKERKDIRFRS